MSVELAVVIIFLSFMGLLMYIIKKESDKVITKNQTRIDEIELSQAEQDDNLDRMKPTYTYTETQPSYEIDVANARIQGLEGIIEELYKEIATLKSQKANLHSQISKLKAKQKDADTMDLVNVKEPESSTNAWTRDTSEGPVDATYNKEPEPNLVPLKSNKTVPAKTTQKKQAIKPKAKAKTSAT